MSLIHILTVESLNIISTFLESVTSPITKYLKFKLCKFFLFIGITDGAFAYDSTGASADEITVLRVGKNDDIDKVKQALETRMSQRQQDFGGYKPEEAAKASDGKVFACSNYVFLGICDDSSAARSAFMKFMQSAAQ